MSLHSLKQQQTLNISLDEAWNFFSSPINLNIITPPYMKFKVLSDFSSEDKIYPGMLINYTVSPLFNLPLNWTTEITAVQDHHYFIDEQRFGPFAFWQHQHFFEEINGSVLIKDAVHYRIPFGFIGDVVNEITVKKKVESIFNFRRKKLAELYPSALTKEFIY
ncbi:MAG: SRPBCC family protein [Chitinophagales bacterium]|nr:SRPBCC family protein [Chitinophagales bacterium]